jgi:prophage antirepressor-like protein
MNNIKIEKWNGHSIRFILREKEWWAVAKDVADALGYENNRDAVKKHCKNAKTIRVKTCDVAKRYVTYEPEALHRPEVCDALKQGVTSGTEVCDAVFYRVTSDKKKARKTQDVLIVNELDMYRLVFHSKMPEAESFQEWVFDLLKELRVTLGLEGFELFRLLDKEQQKAAMKRLHDGLKEPVKVDYIKANTIANKVIATNYGYQKMIPKEVMNEAMLAERESMLADIVELMNVQDRFNLELSISQTIYEKYGGGVK